MTTSFPFTISRSQLSMRFPFAVNHENSAATLLHSLRNENCEMKIEATGGRA
jgi:hypothetical protein